MSRANACWLGTALVLFVLGLLCFSRLVSNPSTDFPFHIETAAAFWHGGKLPAHLLFHACIVVLLMGSSNYQAASACAVVVLALAEAARGWLICRAVGERARVPRFHVVLVCLAVLLAMPLPNWWNVRDVYMGQASPNVWHNPTHIFAAPLVLLALLRANRLLAHPAPSTALGAGLALAVSALAKPNFALAFAPCLAVSAAFSLGRAARQGSLRPGQAVLLFAAALAPLVGVLALQFLNTYRGTPGSGITVGALVVWRMYSPNIVTSVVLGVAFPLTVVVCYPRQVAADRMSLLAWSTLTVAVAQFALLAEKGPWLVHANFAWGMYAAVGVLFVACCVLLGRQAPGRRYWVCACVLGLHAASGTVYLLNLLRTGTWRVV